MTSVSSRRCCSLAGAPLLDLAGAIFLVGRRLCLAIALVWLNNVFLCGVMKAFGLPAAVPTDFTSRRVYTEGCSSYVLFPRSLPASLWFMPTYIFKTICLK